MPVNGQFYGGTTGATPTTGGSYNVALTATTPIAFKALVDNL